MRQIKTKIKKFTLTKSSNLSRIHSFLYEIFDDIIDDILDWRFGHKRVHEKESSELKKLTRRVARLENESRKLKRSS